MVQLRVYQERRESGLCGSCGALPTNGRAFCQTCLDKNNAAQRRRRKNKESVGLCRCGRKLVDGKKRCSSCLEKEKQRMITKTRSFLQKKICPQCHALLNNNKSLCDKCLKRQNYNNCKRRKKLKENGLCRHCKNKTSNGMTYCKRCLSLGRHNRQNKKKQGLCIQCGNKARSGKTYCINCSLTHSLRGKLHKAITRKNIRKNNSAIKLVGCSIQFLKQYLENQFKYGMSWKNYGKWHIDHIRPIITFDLTKKEEQQKAFHYTNLQPLWQSENCSKGGKYEK